MEYSAQTKKKTELKQQPKTVPEIQKNESMGEQSGFPAYLQRSTFSSSPQTVQSVFTEKDDEAGQKGIVQTKLTVGAPNDEYEQEADQVSNKVMRMPESSNQSIDDDGTPKIQTKLDDSSAIHRVEEEEENIQAKANGATTLTTSNKAAQIVSSPSSGSPLSNNIRSRVEPVLNSDLSQARVHNDTRSNEAAKSINARAFTHKNNIFLGSGQSANDVALMAHELTHTVQQTGGINLKKQTATSPTKTSRNQVPNVQAAKRSWYNFGIPGTDYYFDPSIRGVKNAANIAKNTAKEGIKAVLSYAAKLARKNPGYKLLTLIINKDLITGDSVDQGQLLSEMLSTVPYGKKLAEHIKHLATSTAKAMSWIGSQFTESGFTLTKIGKRFKQTVNGLGLSDILIPPKAAYKIIDNFVIPVASSAVSFVWLITKKLFGKIFQWLLEKLGPHAKSIMGFINKAGSVLSTIAQDPIGFAKNLGRALKLGFYQFRDHFLKKHLPSAIAEMVFGPLNIKIPETLNFSSVFNLVLQLMDLTYDSGLRPKLVKRLGEKRVGFIESSVTLIQEVKNKGISVLWDKMKQFVGNLKDLVIGKLKSWLITRVVIAGIKWIAGLILPGGAFIKAIQSIYAMFEIFLDRWRQIGEVITNVFNSISRIASGNIETAANKIEGILGKGLSIIVGFLAKLVGLGGVAAKVREIIESIKGRIHDAMDKLVGYIVKLISKMFGKAKFAIGKALQWWKRRRSLKGGDKKTYTISISGGEKTPQLMLKASPKRRFSKFLKSRESQATTPEQKAALIVAKQQAEIIEKQRKKPSESDAKFAEIKLNAFNSIADQLLIITGGSPNPISVFQFGGLNEDQGGTEMTAKILSKDHPKGSHVSDKPPIWSDLYHMRKGMGPPYYIQGHLLNNNLGGPGKRYNLSPITTKANKDHLDNVEKHIKGWVHNRTNPAVMYYSVMVNYPSLSDSERFKELRNKTEADRTVAEKRELAILTQQRLATSFTCSAYLLKYAQGNWIPDKDDSTHKINYVVKNK